ncbi:translational machinery component [Schizopora paradoxa]|uniref:Translational machinery component n=1 Tax=Schizopora paradoxa TaxID=27342 RepID=A0A0H2RHY7_9AGAM|nr:translational machinery component [Schizopora paradoxa]
MQAFRQACSSFRPLTSSTRCLAGTFTRLPSSSRFFADVKTPQATESSSSSTPTPASLSAADKLLDTLVQNKRKTRIPPQASTSSPSPPTPTDSSQDADAALPESGALPGADVPSTTPGGGGSFTGSSRRLFLLSAEEYRLYAQCTNNNVILTLAAVSKREVDRNGRPKSRTVAWVSGGTCKFKNAQRASYEAGYQASVAMFGRIAKEIEERKVDMKLEILFSGKGMGREALQKALLTSEGDLVRDLVWKVTDRTPIKIGGTRAKKARRL